MRKIIFVILALIVIISTSVLTAFADDDLIDVGNMSQDESSIALASVDKIQSGETSLETTSKTENSTISADNKGELDLEFTTDRLFKTLEHMVVGMAGVLLVLSLIAIVVFALNKVFKPKQ